MPSTRVLALVNYERPHLECADHPSNDTVVNDKAWLLRGARSCIERCFLFFARRCSTCVWSARLVPVSKSGFAQRKVRVRIETGTDDVCNIRAIPCALPAVIAVRARSLPYVRNLLWRRRHRRRAYTCEHRRDRFLRRGELSNFQLSLHSGQNGAIDPPPLTCPSIWEPNNYRADALE